MFCRLPCRLVLDGLLVSWAVAVSVARCSGNINSLEEGGTQSSFWHPALPYVNQCMRLLWFTQKVCNELPLVYNLLHLWWEGMCCFHLCIFACLCQLFECVYLLRLLPNPCCGGKKRKKSRIVRELMTNMRGISSFKWWQFLKDFAFWPMGPGSMAYI